MDEPHVPRHHDRPPFVIAGISIILALAIVAGTFFLILHARSTVSGDTSNEHSSASLTPQLKSQLAAPLACPTCWHPALDTSWQWQLSGTVDQSVNATMYDIDLFENDAGVVASLHAAGRKVICYLDAGTWENWRPDAAQFPAAVLGKLDSGWPGERWLDIRQLSTLQPLLDARLDQCKAKGFDGVEFDNVDGYANDTGFPLTAHDQLIFDVFLANAAHRRGLSVALKNDLGQIPALLPYFDWALDEQCFQYQECDMLLPFIHAGKAVMEVEYDAQPSSFCPQANALNFNSLVKHLDLGSFRIACR
jgi:hypothetical protein